MNTNIKVQDVMDEFIMHLQDDASAKLEDAETCLEMFADYLLHYSDLFQDEIDTDETSFEEWEAALETYMEKLFDGDIERSIELGALPLSMLDAEHVRDFLGWYLLREPLMDSLALENFATILSDWVKFLYQKKYIDMDKHLAFVDMLDDVMSESSRAAKAAHLLLYYVRLGAGVSPRLRGKRFENFVEGHARVENIDMEKKSISFGFDNQDKVIQPVYLPAEILSYLRLGDVLDVELGQRGGQWTIVDIGPVYPACIYVEADELDIPNKLT